MKKLHVAGRYLADQNGEPFFYLGDTAWELFHRLTREEIAYYMTERARQGFTAIQAVALAEFEGLTVPNAYGRFPLKCVDGSYEGCIPDEGNGYDYWQHVDFAVEQAAEHGLFIVLLPTWGDKVNLMWGKGPVIFNTGNAYTYGKWIADRYKDRWNIIWMLGGDRPLEPQHRAVFDAMARGIKDSGDTHLITFHPCGSRNSTEYVNDADYIDFHTSQTGHAVDQTYSSHMVMRAMAQASDKPYLDSEPRYEDHPACFNADYGYLWNADDVRQNAYWNLMEGVCGHTYGNHSIWSMTRKPEKYFPVRWNDALLHPGAEQIHWMKELRLSRDYFSFRAMPNLAADNSAAMGHIAAGGGDGYAFVYSPLGLPFVVHMDEFGGKDIRASWFDPRTGKTEVFAVLPGRGPAQFAPPTQGKGCDWVLVLDVVGK